MFTQPLPHNLLTYYAQQSGKDDSQPPTLLLVAFEGWNDAGEAASQALELIAEHYHLKTSTDFDGEPYYSYTETRPHVMVEKGESQLIWPQTQLGQARTKAGIRILTLTGQEPSLRWKAYSQHVIELVRSEKIDLVIFCGALLDEVPHTQPTPVKITSFSACTLAHQGVQRNSYSGPTGIIGVLAHALGQENIPAISLWASVPHYLAHPPHPKASFTLLSILETMTGIPMPLEKLADEIMTWEQGAQELLEDEPELLAYVRQLESNYQVTEYLEDINGVDIAAEFERYLKDQDG